MKKWRFLLWFRFTSTKLSSFSVDISKPFLAVSLFRSWHSRTATLFFSSSVSSCGLKDERYRRQIQSLSTWWDLMPRRTRLVFILKLLVLSLLPLLVAVKFLLEQLWFQHAQREFSGGNIFTNLSIFTAEVTLKRSNQDPLTLQSLRTHRMLLFLRNWIMFLWVKDVCRVCSGF